MILIHLIDKTEAEDRIKQGLPTIGVVIPYDGNVYSINLNDQKLHDAFFKRFNDDMEGIVFASDIKTMDKGEKVALAVGNYIVEDWSIVEISSVKQLVDNWCATVEEYKKLRSEWIARWQCNSNAGKSEQGEE